MKKMEACVSKIAETDILLMVDTAEKLKGRRRYKSIIG
jgi:hypothetical protein